MDNYFSKLRETLEQKLPDSRLPFQMAQLTLGVRPSLGFQDLRLGPKFNS